MKKINYLSLLFSVIILSFSAISCSKDNGDYASAVSGIYTGKLSVNNTVIEDAYVVSVNRISSTVVSVSAKFYPEGSENYNVEYSNGQYLFKSETSNNITINVIGKNMTISYLNVSGYITTFNGQRD